MRVLLRCEEDNTLCLVESVNVYRNGGTGAICVGLFEGEEERITFDMSEAEYEKRLREALNTGSLDFSDFRFRYSDGSEDDDE